MNRSTITVVFKIPTKNISAELEIPKNMPANELSKAILNIYFNNSNDSEENYYLKCENPIALLRGSRTVDDFGLHDGSIIECDR